MNSLGAIYHLIYTMGYLVLLGFCVIGFRTTVNDGSAKVCAGGMGGLLCRVKESKVNKLFSNRTS